MWQPKIFLGESNAAFVFWQTVHTTIFKDAARLKPEEQNLNVRFSVDVPYPDWQGRRNEQGMPVGRGSPAGAGYVMLGNMAWPQAPTTDMVEKQQRLYADLTESERQMMQYCVRSLSQSGEITVEAAADLLYHSINSGASVANLYDLIRRGVPPGYATQMLYEYTRMHQQASINSKVQDMIAQADERRIRGEMSAVHISARVKSLAEVEADFEWEKQQEANRQKIVQVMGVSAQELGVMNDNQEADEQEELRQIFWNG